MTGVGKNRVVLIVLTVTIASSLISVGVVDSGVVSSSGTSSVEEDFSPPQANIVQNESGGETNDTVPHRHPDEYSEDGAPEDVERWLMDQMINNHAEGATQLNEGEFNRAGQYVDEEYREHLRRYIEVADQTEGESREGIFQSAREEQERTTETVGQYYEIRDEYEMSREEGDEERARELARDLENLAETVDNSSEQMGDHYDELETETGSNLSESDAAIAEVNEEIQREQEDIREEVFIQTELEIDYEDEEISFLDPLVGNGQLRTVDGEPVTDETIRLEIGSDSVRTETDSTGTFDFEYRPTDVASTTDQLEVRYVPDDESTYLGTESVVDVSIEQVEPTVSNLETTDEVFYGDNASVEGDIYAEDVPVDGVSLGIVLEDERIGTAEASNGSFSSAGEVPASVGSGQRELGVELALQDGSEGENGDESYALADTASTTHVDVLETETNLSVSASRTDDDPQDRTVDVNGTLETTSGEGVVGETIQVRADGTTLESVTTGDEGSFTASIEVPESRAEGDVQIVSEYDGSESNLESADGSNLITFPSGAETHSWWGIPAWALIGSGLLVIGTSAWWYHYRYRHPRNDHRPASSQTGDEPNADSESKRESSREMVSQSLLARADNLLSNGHSNEAAEVAYTAVRYLLRSDGDDTGALTHWEFYRHCLNHEEVGVDNGPDCADENPLRTITEYYERATFDVGDISPDEAEDTLECARQLCATPIDDTSHVLSGADD